MIDQKEFWGPKLWRLMHTISYFAPDILTELNRREYYSFYTFVVPRCIMCIKCQFHYRKMIERLQFDGYTKNDLINYVMELHNTVNRRLRKTQLVRNDVDRIYSNKNVHLKEIYDLLVWYKGNVQYGSFSKNNFKVLLVYMNKLMPKMQIDIKDDIKDDKKNETNKFSHPTQINDNKIKSI
jgi:hypothetical protein